MRLQLTVGMLITLSVCLYQASPIQTDVGDYVNSFLVEVENEADAEEIARIHGFHIDDKLQNIGLYHFVHEEIPRRSKRSASHHLGRLKDDARVKFVEQQQILERVKRTISHDKQMNFPIREIEDNNAFYRVSQEGLSLRSQFGEDMGYNDPYYGDQWYIRNTGVTGGIPGIDLNVVPAWKRGVTGKGVVLTILDDGIDHSHPDLVNRYDKRASADFDDKYDRKDDPMPNKRDKSNSHGTRCAGEIAAEANNNVCGVGISHEANIGGIRLLDGVVTDHLEAAALNYEFQYVDIYSASWGPKDDGITMEGPKEGTLRALANGAKNGRGGLGSIFVWATGNGGDNGDDCSADYYVSNVFTLSVGSINDRGEMPYFMEVCSSTMVVVPSGGDVYPGESDQIKKPKIKVVTTDLNGRCTETFEGTSAAAPLAAGCVALLLQANDKLTWRDVQHITAKAARIPNSKDDMWWINGASYHTNHKYGFGLMDCGYMVELAQEWTRVPDQLICSTDTQQVERDIVPGSCVSFTMDSDKCHSQSGEKIDHLEHVQIHIVMGHSRRGDINIFLTSPMGTISEMLSPRSRDNSNKGIDFTFTTIHNWGEDPMGTWKMKICDEPGKSQRNNKGVVHSWSLKLYGTAGHVMAREKVKPYSPDKQERENIMDRERKRSLHVDIDQEDGTPMGKKEETPPREGPGYKWKDQELGRLKDIPEIFINRGLSSKKMPSGGNTEKQTETQKEADQLISEMVDDIEKIVREKKMQNNRVRESSGARNRKKEEEINEVIEEILDILES